MFWISIRRIRRDGDNQRKLHLAECRLHPMISVSKREEHPSLQEGG